MNGQKIAADLVCVEQFSPIHADSNEYKPQNGMNDIIISNQPKTDPSVKHPNWLQLALQTC